jgi:hypothetical protein
MNAHTWLGHAAIAIAIAFVLAFVLERSRIAAALPAVLTLAAGASMLMLIALVANHVRFPFQIDVMESVVMQHARRALHGQSIYPLPTPDYVPLAYNALYYVLAVPFLKLFGDTFATLRLVSVIALVGSAGAIFLIVRRSTRSAWWGAIGAGLFCAAYPAMDAYLDTAHSDAWLLCSALWGTYLVGRDSRTSRIGGILVLVAAFWFKQHGAVFAAAALVCLTLQEGVRKSLIYWLLAFVFGAVLYVWAPGTLLGPDFHYFTWKVPGGWSELHGHTLYRVTLYAATYYGVLALAGVAGVWRALRNRKIDIIDAQFGAALLTALMGALDPGSSYNVFAPMGAFLIMRGTVELGQLSERDVRWVGLRPGLVGALLAFATLARDPRPYWLPSATAQYADLQATIRALPGTVYAPGIGQLVDGPKLYPAAHWVALEDIYRGPRRTAADSALAKQMLEPAFHPAGAAYMLVNRPLATLSTPVSELAPVYTLEQDYGTRFAALEGLPRPFDTGYPRYLYRFTGAGVQPHAP